MVDLKSELWLVVYDEEGHGWSYYWDAVVVDPTCAGWYRPLGAEWIPREASERH